MIWYLWWLILTEVIFIVFCILVRDAINDIGEIIQMKFFSIIIGLFLTGVVFLFDSVLKANEVTYKQAVIAFLQGCFYALLFILGILILFLINYFIYKLIAGEISFNIKKRRKKK